MIGCMEMPADFRHAELFRLGRPHHEKFDDFWLRHPFMDPAHRAKIFAPFDALEGFSEELARVESEQSLQPHSKIKPHYR